MAPRALLAAALAIALGSCTLAGLRGPGVATVTEPAATTAPATSPATAALRPIPDGHRVRLGRLGIDLPIREGVLERDVEQQQTPEGFAFHLPGTSVPGAPGNTYLYAHARHGMFLALWDARLGDVVEILMPDGTVLTYVVAEIRPRVPPTDVSVAGPTEDERLTLQTSTGPGPDDPRFVVIARRRG